MVFAPRLSDPVSVVAPAVRFVAKRFVLLAVVAVNDVAK